MTDIEEISPNFNENASLSSFVLEFAARKRGLEVRRSGRTIVLVRLGNALVPFSGLNGPDSSAVGRELVSHRDGTLYLASSSGIPVPRYSTFTEQQIDNALVFAEELGWPLLIGPARGAGRVMVKACDEADLRAAWRRSVAGSGGRVGTKHLVVTEYVHGETLHAVVVDETVVSVTHIVAANVEGDGRTPISGLIAQKNAIRSGNCFLRHYPIPADPVELDAFAGRTLGAIAAGGERIVLRSSPSTLVGADVVDVTERVSPEIERLAVAAVRAIPGLPYAGVEIVTDTTSDDSAWVGAGRSEVVKIDWSPPLSGRFPTHGGGRDIGGAIIDHYQQRPRWLVAQETGHQLSAVGSTAPMWRG